METLGDDTSLEEMSLWMWFHSLSLVCHKESSLLHTLQPPWYSRSAGAQKEQSLELETETFEMRSQNWPFFPSLYEKGFDTEKSHPYSRYYNQFSFLPSFPSTSDSFIFFRPSFLLLVLAPTLSTLHALFLLNSLFYSFLLLSTFLKCEALLRQRHDLR